MTKHRIWIFVSVAILSAMTLLQGAVSKGEEPSRIGSLKALERRALMAQALVQQVEELDKKIEKLQENIEAQQATAKDLREELELCQEKIASLEKTLAKRDDKIEKQRNMIDVLRKGSFEYYEVNGEESLEAIAAKPMVYGDASRADMIREANNLKGDDKLSSGTILIIPRYPEGVMHEL